MAHNESYSLDPENDRGLIEWLNHPNKKGKKSETTKKALYLYKDMEDALDLANLADKIKLIPKILEVVSAIEARVNNLRYVNGSDNDGSDHSADENMREMALDMLDQMENLED